MTGGEREHFRRRCVSCRETAGKFDLARFVWDGRRVAADKEHRLPGRGGYVHKRPGCLQRALELKRWEQAFRLVRGSVCSEALEDVRTLLDTMDGRRESPQRRRLRL